MINEQCHLMVKCQSIEALEQRFSKNLASMQKLSAFRPNIKKQIFMIYRSLFINLACNQIQFRLQILSLPYAAFLVF